MRGECSTYGEGEKCIQDLDWNASRKEMSEDLRLDGRIILKLILKVSWMGGCELDCSGKGSGPVVG
jgi:hypothetical protein